MAAVNDGFAGLRGGMDMSISPLLLSEDRVSRALNVSFRDFMAATRPAFIEERLLPQGDFQGAGVWGLNSGDRMAFVVSGDLYTLGMDNGLLVKFADAVTPGNQCFFTQVDRFMVVQDGSPSDATVTVNVSDGELSTAREFRLVPVIRPGDEAPEPIVVAGVADIVVPGGSAAGPYMIELRAGSDEDVKGIVISVSSSDTDALPLGSIRVLGTGRTRALFVGPPRRASGESFVTLSAEGITPVTFKVSIPEPRYTAAEALNPALEWSGTDWDYVDARVAPTGSAAYASGPATLRTTVDGGNNGGTLRFHWSVLSQAPARAVLRTLKGATAEDRLTVTGDLSWRGESVTLPAGIHTLEWVLDTASEDDSMSVSSVAFVPMAAYDQDAAFPDFDKLMGPGDLGPLGGVTGSVALDSAGQPHAVASDGNTIHFYDMVAGSWRRDSMSTGRLGSTQYLSPRVSVSSDNRAWYSGLLRNTPGMGAIVRDTVTTTPSAAASAALLKLPYPQGNIDVAQGKAVAVGPGGAYTTLELSGREIKTTGSGTVAIGGGGDVSFDAFGNPAGANEGATLSDATVSKGGTTPVDLRYDAPWTLTLDGTYSLNAQKRIAQTGTTNNDGLDLFMWDGKLSVRLYNRRIQFTAPEQGSLFRPAPPDHWAMSVAIGNKLLRGSHKLSLTYIPGGSGGTLEAYLDGDRILRTGFVFNSGVPAARKTLHLHGFSGKVKLSTPESGSAAPDAEPVYHVASGGSGVYRNSLMASAAAWLSPGSADGPATVAADYNQSGSAYIVARSGGRVVANIWNGSGMAADPADPIIIDPASDNHPPRAASFPGGGAFVLWTRGGSVVTRYISRSGRLGEERVLTQGVAGDIVAGADGSLHILLFNGGVARFIYVPPSETESVGDLYSGNFELGSITIRDLDAGAGSPETPFTLETSAGLNTIVKAISDNPVLLPDSAISVSAVADRMTIAVSPAHGLRGKATVTLFAGWNGAWTGTSFDVNVGRNEEHEPMTISPIRDVYAKTGVASRAAVFEVGHEDAYVEFDFAEGDVLDREGIDVSGTGTSRQLVLTPTGAGDIPVYVYAVKDGVRAVSRLTLRASDPGTNTPPIVDDFEDVEVGTPGIIGPFAITAFDLETAAADLVVTATSDNDIVLPASGITILGSGENRQLWLRIARPPAMPVILEEHEGEPRIYDPGEDGTVPSIPKGFTGVYANGRLHMVPYFVPSTRENGRPYLVSGDIMQPLDPATVLQFTETEYLAEGGAHGLPLEMGYVSAVGALRNSGTGTGVGNVIALAQRGVCSFDFSLPRMMWKSQPISSVLFFGSGCRSPWSVLNVNNDLLYRGVDGLRSIGFTASQSSGGGGMLGNTPLSRAVGDWIDTDFDGLQYVSCTLADHRVLCTASAFRDKLFRGIVAWDVYHLDRPAYDGLWTGDAFAQVLNVSREGKSVAMVFADGPRLYRIEPDAYRDITLDPDTGEARTARIESRVHTRTMGFLDLGGSKRLSHVDIWLSDIRTELDLAVWFRPRGYPKWFRLGERHIAVADGGMPQQRHKLRIGLDNASGFCDPSTGRSPEVATAFQFALQWTGHAVVERFSVSADQLLEAPPEPCDNAESAAVMEADPVSGETLGDFTYSMREV